MTLCWRCKVEIRPPKARLGPQAEWMTMDLSSAITNRQLVAFTYDGLPRLVQPATYGQTATGKWSLRACQIDGLSRRNSVPCWEIYTESKMQGAHTTGATFQQFAMSGYTRGDSMFPHIVAQH